MLPRKFGVRSAMLLLAASLLLIACSGGSAPPSSAAKPATAPASAPSHSASTAAKENTVAIKQFKNQPETLTVYAGEIVEWKNEDIFPHSATAKDGKAFDSGSMATGASWRFTTSQKGTFDYTCTLHPNMKGKLIVQ